MNPKMMIRKKAMESMMSEGDAMPMQKKPMPMEQEAGKLGMVSMMVTPEEKQMIEEMRAGKEEGQEGEVEAAEPMMGEE